MQFPIHHPSHVVRTLWIVVAVVGGFAALAMATFSIGLYSAGWHDGVTHRVAQVIAFPAASMGWKFVPTDMYLDQLNALRRYQTVQSQRAPGTITKQSEADLRRATLRKSLRDAATESILEGEKIAIKDVDVDQAYSSQIAQVGNRASTEDAIQELYGWGPTEYKHNVIRPAVAREKLREHLSFSDSRNRAAKKQAETVFAIVQAGEESFEALAKKYSDDVYGASGGDVGFVRRGEQADEIEDASFGLEPGQTSELVHTKYGWHILKVTERREVEGQLEIHLYQIFISGPSVDDFITDYLKQKKVSIWIPGLRWDTKTADVVVD